MALEDRLGYRFRKPAYLQQALRHRSVGGEHNQRLEFLGDALLGWLVAQWLSTQLPQADEGQLTRLRARFVGSGYLAQVAKRLDLDQVLDVDKSVGLPLSDKLLADAVEAVFAAMYLDGGEVAQEKILQCLLQDLPHDWERGADKDAKTLLQEYTQAHGLALPAYEVVADKLKGDGYYKVTLVVADERVEGYSKTAKTLKMQLAQTMLARLAQRGKDATH